MSKLGVIKKAARDIVLGFRYEDLGTVLKGDFTVCFGAIVRRSLAFILHMLMIATLPLSVFFVIWVRRKVEVANLKGWVATMRKDRYFFDKHYYIEIKDHLRQYEENYTVLCEW